MDKHEINEPTNWTLLARYLSGECSPEEEYEVQEWLTNSPENRRLLKFMKRVWNTSESPQQQSEVDAMWKRVAARGGITTVRDDDAASQKIRRTSLLHADNYRFLRIAISFLIVITLGYAISTFMPWGQHQDLLTLTVANGHREKLTWDDGTNIVLDAGSTFRYPEQFTGETREVFLSGEGYFEVSPDAYKPFLVHANHATVRVLGTRFNVRAWQPDRRVTVAVSEGKVSLMATAGTPQHTAVISAGQASILLEDDNPAVPTSVNVDRYIGWMKNEMNFQDASVQEILFQLERWHDVNFIISDSAIVEERLNIHLQNQSLDEILVILSTLTDLDVQRQGKQIELLSKGSQQE
jgi:ferric-dicitrate binding protein FerR (iron transport regulator)